MKRARPRFDSCHESIECVPGCARSNGRLHEVPATCPVSDISPWDAFVSDRTFYLQQAQFARASRVRWMRAAREWRAAGAPGSAARCVEAARAQSKQVLNCMRLADQALLP